MILIVSVNLGDSENLVMASKPPPPDYPGKPDLFREKPGFDLPPVPQDGPTMSPFDPKDFREIPEPEVEPGASPEDAPTNEDIEKMRQEILEPLEIVQNDTDGSSDEGQASDTGNDNPERGPASDDGIGADDRGSDDNEGNAGGEDRGDTTGGGDRGDTGSGGDRGDGSGDGGGGDAGGDRGDGGGGGGGDAGGDRGDGGGGGGDAGGGGGDN
jgi:hypothetical protein